MTLGEKIQALRKGRQMSQEQLADRLGVSRQSISKWELGESAPDIGNLIGLSNLLGVSLDVLMKEELSLEDASAAAAEDLHDGRTGVAVGLGYGVALFLGLLLAAVLGTHVGVLGKGLGSVLIGCFGFLALGQLIHLLIVLRRK